MLVLFIPWGIDDQNQQFLAAESFVSLWAEAKETLSPRLKFHVDNFENLRKSREDIHTDRKRQDTQWGKAMRTPMGQMLMLKILQYLIPTMRAQVMIKHFFNRIYQMLSIAFLHLSIPDGIFGSKWLISKRYQC